MMMRSNKIIAAAAIAFTVSACSVDGEFYGTAPVVVRQPVVPEMLVNCNGHVLVPALGMTLVLRSKEPPTTGQYLREERLSPPYRVIPPGVSVSSEQSPARVNIELGSAGRIIGLFCG
jgi:hypothetical protein